MPRKYTIRSKEEKLAIVKKVLAGKSIRAREPDIRNEQVRQRIKKYQAEGEAGLEPKKRPGNPLSCYERRRELSYTEQLQYQIEQLKQELAAKEAVVARIKQSNARKEGDVQRK